VDERGSTTSGHDHAFEVPDGFRDPEGRDIDNQLLGQFAGAAFDGCQECQAVLMGRMAGDPAVTARLVELACVAINEAVGGLPPSLTDPGAVGLAAPEFRRLAAAGAGGNNDAMFALAETMTCDERRAAMETAADLVTGFLARMPR
jgi:hypothetical protein